MMIHAWFSKWWGLLARVGSTRESRGRDLLMDAKLTEQFYSLTQATDTSNIRLVFAAVKDTILHNALADSGIL